MDNKKKDCFFYCEDYDMGATIPCCEYFGIYSGCPCDRCKKYIKASDAVKIIKERVDKGDI